MERLHHCRLVVAFSLPHATAWRCPRLHREGKACVPRNFGCTPEINLQAFANSSILTLPATTQLEKSLCSERRLHELAQPLTILVHVIQGNLPSAHRLEQLSLESGQPALIRSQQTASTVPTKVDDADFIGVCVGAMDLSVRLAKSRKHIWTPMCPHVHPRRLALRL